MENKQPLISICIPTKNRADVLNKCLKSIFSNNYYNRDLIEVVVSDNCSTDNTEEIVSKFLVEGNNLIYNRNSENLGVGGNANFLKVLSLANGLFLKINNDYSVFTDNGISYLIDFVKKYKDSKPSLYFVHKNVITPVYKKIDSIDALLEDQKWGLSWLGSMGYWKESFDILPEKEKMIPTRFVQIDWFLRTFSKNGCVICTAPFTTREQFSSQQGGYNFIEVHTKNFIGMFEPYVDSGDIKESTLVAVKRDLLYTMLDWVDKLKADNGTSFTYSHDGWFDILYKQYKQYWWFYYIVARRYIRNAIMKVKIEL